MSLPSIPGYRLYAKIKDGGSAAIFKAARYPHESVVALKVMHEQHVGSSIMQKAFQNEVQFLEKLRHPNIIVFCRVVKDAPRPTYEMEFFDSKPLSAILAEKQTMTPEEAVPVLIQASKALEYTHSQDVLHKDIKPSNILVDADGDVRLIDFSIAEAAKRGFFAKLFGGKRDIQGTLSYVAPEHLLRKDLGPPNDVWSLGVTIFELLSGKKPFTGRNQQDLAQTIIAGSSPTLRGASRTAPKALDELVAAMLRKDPEKRPPMAEVIEQLEAAC